MDTMHILQLSVGILNIGICLFLPWNKWSWVNLFAGIICITMSLT